MKTGGGHAKGALWERYVCRRLSQWITHGRRDDCMWRTAMSGGRATFQLRKGILNRAQAGDVAAITAEGMSLCDDYVFECKHHHDLNFTAFLTGRGGKLIGFWWQTQQAAEKIGKLPVLIAKQDRYPAVVICPHDCSLFTNPWHSPWAIFPAYEAALFDFETVTTVVRPTIKRPRGRDETAQASDDGRAVVHLRNQVHSRPAP